jgi:hypothetical protein
VFRIKCACKSSHVIWKDSGGYKKNGNGLVHRAALADKLFSQNSQLKVKIKKARAIPVLFANNESFCGKGLLESHPINVCLKLRLD